MHKHLLTPLQEQKSLLRIAMREKRRVSDKNNYQYFNKLEDIFLRHIVLEKGAVIASYCAIRNEMDPATLSETLRARGHKIALPVVASKGAPLLFRLYEQGDRLLSNPMGLLEPSAEAQEVDPDILLVPLLAFDSKRNRLGYGGGYYDRTITKLRAQKPILALGIAYAYQEIGAVPVGPNDTPMDKIVTELNVF
jgi:5-formyltetrahydrofolate cyclo-ligase